MQFSSAGKHPPKCSTHRCSVAGVEVVDEYFVLPVVLVRVPHELGLGLPGVARVRAVERNGGADPVHDLGGVDA